MLANESQLARSCELIARMNQQIADAASEKLWPEASREDYIVGVQNAMNKIKREVYEYLKNEYEAAKAPTKPVREKELVA